MSPDSPDVSRTTREYVAQYYTETITADSFALLRVHGASLLDAYIELRKVVFDQTADWPGHLSRSNRELVILAMQIMTRKNPRPILHARKAVEAGATIEEIVDVIGLCMMIGGMITYQDAGQFALREAVTHLERIGARDSGRLLSDEDRSDQASASVDPPRSGEDIDLNYPDRGDQMQPTTPDASGSTDDYMAQYYTESATADSFAPLREHGPHLLEAYIDMRKVAFEQTADQPGHLSRKDRELVILGMEIMARKNPPPIFHAQKAVEVGATIEEIVDVIGLCIMIGGMITYQDAGQFVLNEAIDHSKRLGD